MGLFQRHHTQNPWHRTQEWVLHTSCESSVFREFWHLKITNIIKSNRQCRFKILFTSFTGTLSQVLSFATAVKNITLTIYYHVPSLATQRWNAKANTSHGHIINSPHIFNLQQVPFLQTSYFIPWTTHAKTYFLKTKQHGLNEHCLTVHVYLQHVITIRYLNKHCRTQHAPPTPPSCFPLPLWHKHQHPRDKARAYDTYVATPQTGQNNAIPFCVKRYH